MPPPLHSRCPRATVTPLRGRATSLLVCAVPLAWARYWHHTHNRCPTSPPAMALAGPEFGSEPDCSYAALPGFLPGHSYDPALLTPPVLLRPATSSSPLLLSSLHSCSPSRLLNRRCQTGTESLPSPSHSFKTEQFNYHRPPRSASPCSSPAPEHPPLTNTCLDLVVGLAIIPEEKKKNTTPLSPSTTTNDSTLSRQHPS
jgi:hypothetical protein